MKSYLITFLILVLISGGLYSYFILGNQVRSSRGLAKGGDYVATMYGDYAIAGKSCQGEDSDKDGYITCNFRIQSPQNEKTIVLQCPTFFKSYMATNCKEQGMLMSQ